MATSSRSGSNTAAVVPTAARIRPQFGSPPKMRGLDRLLRATALPTSTRVGLAGGAADLDGDVL